MVLGRACDPSIQGRGALFGLVHWLWVSAKPSAFEPSAVALGENLLENKANTEKCTAEKLRGRDRILILKLQDLVLEHSSHKN